jgi:hypothetical protein
MHQQTLMRMIKPFALLASAVVILLLGASSGQAWANPVQQSSGTVRLVNPTTGEPVIITAPAVSGRTSASTVAPWEGAEISIEGTQIIFPSGAATEPGTIVAKYVELSSAPAPAGQRQVIGVVELNFYDVDGKLVSRPQFNAPISVCFNAGTGSSITVEFYDEGQGKWVVLPSTSSDGKVCGQASHFTLFGAISGTALPDTLPHTSPADTPAGLPNTGNGSERTAGWWLWPMSALALAIGAMLVLRARHSRSQ